MSTVRTSQDGGPPPSTRRRSRAGRPERPERRPRNPDQGSASRPAIRAGLVTIVLPAKNEADAIGQTLRGLPTKTLRLAGFDVETVVLDGRSQDGTPEIARLHGARVVTDEGEGKGAAVRQARFGLAGEYVVMMDADGSYASDAIPRLISRLARDRSDVVMGRRRIRPGAMSPVHRVGNTALSVGASLLYGRRCFDLCTGLWGFRADALHHLPLRSQGFELEAEMFALASRSGLRTSYVDVDYLPRQGVAKLRAARDGTRIGWCLVRSRFGRQPKPFASAPTTVSEVDL